MKTPAHVVVSLILAAALYQIFQWKVVLILAGGVMIDIDHYFWYISKYKKFNLFSCYKYHAMDAKKNKWKDVCGALFVFHTIEFLMLMASLSFYNEFALIFTIGLLPHYMMDILFILAVPKCFILNHSIVYWIYRSLIQKV